VPGPHQPEALERTVAKLGRAAGDAADAGRRISVDIEADNTHDVALRKALAEGSRIHLQYYVPARDEVTSRDVDPLRMVVVDGRWPGFARGILPVVRESHHDADRDYA